MKVLFDHNVDRRFRKHLPGHDIRTAREMGWDQLINGALLKSAANGKFEALLSIDKKLEHEQNLRLLPLPVVVIDSPSNALPDLIPFAGLLLNCCTLRSTPYFISSNPMERCIGSTNRAQKADRHPAANKCGGAELMRLFLRNSLNSNRPRVRYLSGGASTLTRDVRC